MSAIVEAIDATRIFRTQGGQEKAAVLEATIAVESGSYIVLTGPSGSGKSTLLSLFGALDRPTRGEIRLFGSPLSEASDAEQARLRRRVGFVFQQFYLLPRLPLWENVSYPLIPLGIGPRERQARAIEMLNLLGLADRAQSRPEELSGGETQRIALARGLIANPELILADEPASNLDAETAAIVMEHLAALNEQGKTVVIATHDVDLVPEHAQRYRIVGGRPLPAET